MQSRIFAITQDRINTIMKYQICNDAELRTYLRVNWVTVLYRTLIQWYFFFYSDKGGSECSLINKSYFTRLVLK